MTSLVCVCACAGLQLDSEELVKLDASVYDVTCLCVCTRAGLQLDSEELVKLDALECV